MLINFREDLQINLAPLPEGLQRLKAELPQTTSMRSTRCPGRQQSSLPMYAILRLGCMLDNSDLTMHGRARGEGDSVMEASTLCP